MNLKPGYKQTDVGAIPEEWETRSCSELSDRIMVGVLIRPTQYYVRNGIPAFRSANIREDGINDLDLVFISEKSDALLAKSQTRAGDVLTVRTGYPGTSAVVRPRHAGSNCIDILITRPSASVLDSDYLAIWVNSSFGKEQVLRNQGGNAQKHFNVGDMRNLVVALPPLPEQRAIADVLSDMDALLGGLDRLIAKKRDLKQAAMQQLLTGQTRLPGFHGEWEASSRREEAHSSQHYFLGRRYRLRLVKTDGPPRITIPRRSHLELHAPENSTAARRQNVLHRWYRSQLQKLVPPLLAKWQPKLDVQLSSWTIRRMKTKWGSCNPDTRHILLNLELAKKPVQCLEYILVHELSHLHERHHDDRFTAILDKHLPTWRSARTLLNSEPLAHATWSY
jgi:predicted metal-dependent hydrolase